MRCQTLEDRQSSLTEIHRKIIKKLIMVKNKKKYAYYSHPRVSSGRRVVCKTSGQVSCGI